MAAGGGHRAAGAGSPPPAEGTAGRAVRPARRAARPPALALGPGSLRSCDWHMMGSRLAPCSMASPLALPEVCAYGGGLAPWLRGRAIGPNPVSATHQPVPWPVPAAPSIGRQTASTPGVSASGGDGEMCLCGPGPAGGGRASVRPTGPSPPPWGAAAHGGGLNTLPHPGEEDRAEEDLVGGSLLKNSQDDLQQVLLLVTATSRPRRGRCQRAEEGGAVLAQSSQRDGVAVGGAGAKGGPRPSPSRVPPTPGQRV